MRTGVMCPKGIICQYVNRNRNRNVIFSCFSLSSALLPLPWHWWYFFEVCLYCYRVVAVVYFWVELFYSCHDVILFLDLCVFRCEFRWPWLRRYTLNAYFLSIYYGQNVCMLYLDVWNKGLLLLLLLLLLVGLIMMWRRCLRRPTVVHTGNPGIAFYL